MSIYLTNFIATKRRKCVKVPDKDAPHPPVIRTETSEQTAVPGQEITLHAEIIGLDDASFSTNWFFYPEAGTIPAGKIPVLRADATTAVFAAPNQSGTLHLILAVM